MMDSIFDIFKTLSNNAYEYRLQAKEQFMQFSKEPIMTNFGELPFGEIPEPLKYVRPFSK